MNQLIDVGVAGFRIDAAKHMWPRDIDAILDSLHLLNTRWFPANTTPYVYQEVWYSNTHNLFVIAITFCSNINGDTY